MENYHDNKVEEKENPVVIKITYSLEREARRLQHTIEKIPWYREQGYLNVALPEGLSEQSHREEIIDVVGSQYVEKDYEMFEEAISEQWSLLVDRVGVLRDMTSFNLKDQYTIVLTKYGSGGSYNSQTGEVIVNIKDREKDLIMGTILHEIVHIGIEHLIESYHITHWRKERLVDLIMEKCFPDLKKTQYIKEDVSTVDRAFKKNFPDMESIAREVGGVIEFTYEQDR